MGLDIVSNIMAQQASNDLSTNESNMQGSLEKLSSGYQINTAADDASGLVISQHLQAQIGAFQQAQSNTQAGVNVVQTADGALNEVSTILQRINTLAVESQNSTAQDPTAQQAAQAEVSQALQSIQDIASTTVYGNQYLLTNGANNTVNYTFQTGWDGSAASQVAFSVTALNLANIGLVQNALGTLGGTAEGPTGVAALTGNVASGAHTLLVTAATAGTYTGGANSAAIGATHSGPLTVTVNGTAYTINVTASETVAAVEAALNGPGGAFGSSGITISGATGSALVISAPGSVAGGISVTGNANVLSDLGLTTGTVVTGANAQVSMDGGAITSLSAAQNVAGGTFSVTSANGGEVIATLGATVAAGTGTVGGTVTATQTYLLPNNTNYSVTSANAIADVQQAISTVSAMQGKFGSYQNQLQDISDNETVGIQNLTASNANIEDTNMASQMVSFTQDQVLVQAGVSMLAQANQIPQYVLKLLG
jgi:flagellin